MKVSFVGVYLSRATILLAVIGHPNPLWLKAT